VTAVHAGQAGAARPAGQPSPAWLRRYLSTADFERAARRRLPRAVYEFVSGGSEDGAACAPTAPEILKSDIQRNLALMGVQDIGGLSEASAAVRVG